MKADPAVIDRIRTWARSWGSVRAVILTSSRADPRRTPDLMSDYDLQVFVRDTDAVIRDDAWLEPFGAVVVRWPLRPRPTFSPAWVTQLVLFTDGLRIDFQFTAGKERLADEHDPYYVVLVDKDGIAASWAPPAEYPPEITPPTEETYRQTMNDFWWDVVYVAKGLWRGELPYARYMLDSSIRSEHLARLLEWYVGVTRGWDAQVGAYGRWLSRVLDEQTWGAYLMTFADSSLAASWSAMLAALDLAANVGRQVGAKLGYAYPEQVDRLVRAYIRPLVPGRP
jgi:aminoglycoside 6-adenylyltransferase